jgi:hypothetical protein
MNIAGPGYSWRVVYDAAEKSVIAIVESSGKTTSIHSIAEFQTEAEAVAFIQANGLKMPPEQSLESNLS